MADYLQSVGKVWRLVSIVGCTLTSVICLLLSIMLWTGMIHRHSVHYNSKPLWIGAVIIGAIGVAAAFIAWRLVRRHSASNGITVMPAWFIQIFGVFLMIGLCLVAYFQGLSIFMIEGAFVCVAMIFVGRHIDRKQRQKL